MRCRFHPLKRQAPTNIYRRDDGERYSTKNARLGLAGSFRGGLPAPQAPLAASNLRAQPLRTVVEKKEWLLMTGRPSLLDSPLVAGDDTDTSVLINHVERNLKLGVDLAAGKVSMTLKAGSCMPPRSLERIRARFFIPVPRHHDPDERPASYKHTRDQAFRSLRDFPLETRCFLRWVPGTRAAVAAAAV